MATSVTGVSTLDVNSIVSQLMTLERRPIELLNTKEAGLQAKVSAYGSLKGAISGFQTSMVALQTPAKFTANTASLSDATVISASVFPAAAEGAYDIDITQTALSHVVKSAGVASDLTSGSTGTVTLQVGGGAITTVTIDSSNNTLRGLRDAINGAKAGVQASIVNDGTEYRLVLTGGTSGAANTISVTNSLTAGTLNDALDGVTEARPAQNAIFSVNGVGVSSTSNTVTSAITGVTLNLTKAGTSTITVARDTPQGQAAVQSFVKAYNDLQKSVTDLTKYDIATKKASLLYGDSSAVAFLASIRKELETPLTGLGGQYANLTQIGVTFQRDGTLAMDSAKLTTALKAAPEDVAALFARQGTSNNALVSYTSSTSATSAGAWQVDVTTAATRAAATAANAPAGSTVIDGTNDGMSFTIDSVASGSLTLAHGSYTPEQLALLVQNTLNGAAPFSAAKVEVAVSVDGGGKLRIESQAYGTVSTVADAGGTAAASLGFDGAETAAGSNVAGTFTLNGGAALTATGSGQVLTGPTGGAAEGLTLKYAGIAGQLIGGSDGTVSVSEGYGSRLARLAEQALGLQGVVQGRTEGLAASIKDIGSRRELLNTRLVGVEKRLRLQ